MRSTRYRITTLLFAALLASGWCCACDEGRDEETELQPRPCVCCDIAETTCELACECDPSDACSLFLDPADVKTYGSHELCFGAMSVHCSENLLDTPKLGICGLTAPLAQCVETADGMALALPNACFD
jgi:hypothetical protein